MPSPNALLKMYVEVEGELSQFLCLTQIEKNLLNTLKKCVSSRADDTCITQEGPIKLTTIATYFELKKIPEKSGAT
jgi:hypothetical protein